MTIIRAAEWHLGPETAEGAPTAIYVVECVECGDDHAVDNQQLEVELWALRHTGRNTDHRQYRVTIETFWRASAAPGNPLHSEAERKAIQHAQEAARSTLDAARGAREAEPRTAGNTGRQTP